jgi:NAD(P)-dependent dehydrogenase (short-subunit alcohol dehydrogenase family)
MTPEKPRPPFPEQDLSPPGLEAKMKPKPRFRAPDYRGSGKLDGDVALITGGDSGIGRAVAVLFAREGADVALVHLAEEQVDADATAEAVRVEGRRALTMAGDVKDPSFCRQAVERCVAELGRLDVLVNNAAYQKHREGIDGVDEAQWRLTFETNIHAYFYMVKAARPHLRAGARIVQTGSILGLEGSKELVDYSATKGAIHAFTKALAQDLIRDGIRVNCVAPGPVWTPLNPAERGPGETVDFGGDTPMGRPAQPEEIAPAFVYFASNADSSFVTGEVLTLLGGVTRARLPARGRALEQARARAAPSGFARPPRRPTACSSGVGPGPRLGSPRVRRGVAGHWRDARGAPHSFAMLAGSPAWCRRAASSRSAMSSQFQTFQIASKKASLRFSYCR